MKRLGQRCALAIVLALSAVTPAAAQWTSLGAMPAPRQEANSLTFRNRQGTVVVTAVEPHIFRVRFAPRQDLGRDHSYSVVPGVREDPGAVFRIARDRSTITTAALQMTIRHNPFRISMADGQGNSLDEDDPQNGIAFSGSTVRVWKRLRDDEHVYGLGSKTGDFDKRGRKLGGYNYTMWNSDTYAYDLSTDPIYVSVPFFLVLREGRSHGIFFDNTFRSNFDIGHQSEGRLSFGADGGDLNYYFINGPDPKSVITRYTALTGRMPMPPRWGLGYHQSRYSYYPDSHVRFIAQNFRERRIPADVLWLDIHYLDGFNPFTWDAERFPDPPGLIADLRRLGLRLVTILDPHPKKAPGWGPYDSGLAGDHFVKNPDGRVYEAPVWPSKAEKSPGPSVFPDFSKPAARDWWGGLYAPLVKAGVAGIWNDMNEPAVFDTPSGTMPLTVRHDNDGQPTDHREIHNVYGLLMTQATHEGLLRLRPNVRPFVLTRATFAGGQRYAAVWPGDNVSDWGHLRGSIATLMGMGLSGLAFVGSDIGGFAETPSAELYTRWLQTGVFYPFMRTHTTLGTPDQEPWSYGSLHEALNRRAIELRYELLPHIYNVMREASLTGLPALRPLLLEFPGDPDTYGMEDQFMFGAELLVAPVLREGATVREVYLPKGDWFDYWTGQRHSGGARIRLPVTLASIPIFVRAGAVLFSQPVVQHTGEMPGQPIRIRVYPGPPREATLYEDDGDTLDYTRGGSAVRRVRYDAADAARHIVEIGAASGTYRPAPRSLEISMPWDGEPARVVLGNGQVVPRVASDALGAQASGWTIDRGSVIVRQPDSFGVVRIVIER
ncbi:MAG: glycoside hydrolase family 31 protein [Acidobacteriota bacterium]|nr:glycoside hydrolase family 31 protein [Acidobacteriota bacterium]